MNCPSAVGAQRCGNQRPERRGSTQRVDAPLVAIELSEPLPAQAPRHAERGAPTAFGEVSMLSAQVVEQAEDDQVLALVPAAMRAIDDVMDLKIPA